MSEQPERLLIKVEESKDFRRFHATGLFGGINPHGELEIHVMEDALVVPESFQLQRIGPNAYTEVIHTSGDAHLRRIVHAAIVMPSRVIPAIIAWLQAKQKEAEDFRANIDGQPPRTEPGSGGGKQR